MTATFRDQVIAQASLRRGIPYRLPPDGINNLDCSLFIVVTYRDAGIPLPAGVRTAEQIRQACVPIEWADVRLGDLLFFEHTYEPDGPPGPDGRIASHVGISLGAGSGRMWDCHCSSGDSGLPGVTETDVTTSYWSPKLFEARRVPALVGSDDAGPPIVAPSGTRYRLTAGGVRLRGGPGIRRQIVVPDLGEGAIVAALDDETVAEDGHEWRRVATLGGVAGWVATTFLVPVDEASAPVPLPSATRYRLTNDGVRLRAGGGTSHPVLVQDLGKGTVVVALNDGLASGDGHQWRHVRTAGGAVGWVAAEYLEPADGTAPTPLPATRYRVHDDDVRVRGEPSLIGTILDELPAGTIVAAAEGGTVERDGHQWRCVKLADGRTGWMASRYLREVGAGPASDGSELSNADDCRFTFDELRAHIEAAAAKHGADARVVAAILFQESGFKNWRVHHDGTGHGLIGLDDNGLLPDFERWSGLSCGRGHAATTIPPGPQIEYCARIIASTTEQYGSAYNAARVWHRGPGLWKDARGDNYERLIRAHIATLYG